MHFLVTVNAFLTMVSTELFNDKKHFTVLYSISILAILSLKSVQKAIMYRVHILILLNETYPVFHRISAFGKFPTPLKGSNFKPSATMHVSVSSCLLMLVIYLEINCLYCFLPHSP